MLKLIFWLLLIANGALLAFRMGYLDSLVATKSESQRMANQLNTDKIKLIDGKKLAEQAAVPASGPAVASNASILASTAVPASSAPSPAPVPAPTPAKITPCTEVGVFASDEVKKIGGRLAELSLGDRLSKRSVQDVSTYIVFIPPQGGKEGADKKARQLKDRGVKNFFIIQDNSKLRWGISLGVFKSEVAAKNHLASLNKQGVRSARVGARSVKGSRTTYVLRDLDEKSLQTLNQIMKDFPKQKAHECGKE